jgi:hypothetical protein
MVSIIESPELSQAFRMTDGAPVNLRLLYTVKLLIHDPRSKHCTAAAKYSTAKHHSERLTAILQRIERSSDIGLATVAKLRHLLETP